MYTIFTTTNTTRGLLIIPNGWMTLTHKMCSLFNQPENLTAAWNITRKSPLLSYQ